MIIDSQKNSLAIIYEILYPGIWFLSNFVYLMNNNTEFTNIPLKKSKTELSDL